MKVIQQLIAHLHERGRLTQAQLRTFAERGYWGQYTDGDLRTLERNVGQSYYFQGDHRDTIPALHAAVSS